MRFVKIFFLFLNSTLSREIALRANFFLGLAGSFAFVILYLLTLIFITSHVTFGRWTYKEMWVLMGVFYTISYAVFFLFWRGLFRTIREIHTGIFDHVLVLPIDSQFAASIRGGGAHNLIALIFGLGVYFISLHYFGFPIDYLKLLLSLFCVLLAIIDFYCLLIIVISISFRFGEMGEIFWMAFRFQDFTRFPLDAFSYLQPIFLALVVPFSALSTIPAGIVVFNDYPLINTILFVTISIAIMFLTRKVWQTSLKYYSSASS